MNISNSSMMNYYNLQDQIHFNLQTNISLLECILILSLGSNGLIDASLLLEEEYDDCIT